ncbi:hypothetical protein ACOMFI_12865 [Enterobacter cloacae complex sp. YD70/O97D2]|uniref:hypothetical protein n=1 Tax=Enterobacter cloacae complex TaxID=354276 RepID=UPI002892EC4E|nr:hypothetical protein [Enterobacter hormaechei]WMA76266.1 hypothetical protein QPR74_02880 [Enterobacter hormaechei]WMA80971.1 hypothetical protein QPR70_02885 [Enterobacter hormaechei]HCT3534380.1 hypothetical protein [Enterobacter hormaechei]HED1371639.1 hypothetical protein [Enterobacter hormaechei subsp. xiangfangensis]
MSNQSKIILLSLMLFTVEGCSMSWTANKTLSPPPDTKWVNVEVKNPSQYTRPFPLEVRYISYECKKKRISGFDGSVITEPSDNVIKIPMQQESGDIWKAKVAMTGGGSCEWTLSAVNLGIEYIDATHLGKDLVPGTAVGVSLAFDNDSSRNGKFYMVTGNNLKLAPNYYPLIHTNKRIQKNDALELFGKKDFIQKRIVFNVNNDVVVIFSPKLDESKLVKMVAPVEYRVGAYYKIIYPDGTVVSDGSTYPDIRRMEN